MSIKKFWPCAVLMLLLLSMAGSACAASLSYSNFNNLNNFNNTLSMGAYQAAYAMNFEVYQPAGLPAGWYATYDGFPVTQISQNKWVYGQLGLDGAIIPTDILVGSVVPYNVPGLARAAFTNNYGVQVNSEAFRKILNYDVNRMGFLKDNALRTVVAWNTFRPSVYLWLGDRWKRFSPGAGQYAWQVLKENQIWINEELRKNGVIGWGDTFDFANAARQWGILWIGDVNLTQLNYIRHSNGNRSGSVNLQGGSEPPDAPAPEAPADPEPEQDDRNSRGNWDARR
ncbi:MAG: hypothetical protein IJ667_05215 [Synergistaceae bacterium]|nr:hypothetical protein [Synergistaceae bacterium]